MEGALLVDKLTIYLMVPEQIIKLKILVKLREVPQTVTQLILLA